MIPGQCPFIVSVQIEDIAEVDHRCRVVLVPVCRDKELFFRFVVHAIPRVEDTETITNLGAVASFADLAEIIIDDKTVYSGSSKKEAVRLLKEDDKAIVYEWVGKYELMKDGTLLQEAQTKDENLEMIKNGDHK